MSRDDDVRVRVAEAIRNLHTNVGLLPHQFRSRPVEVTAIQWTGHNVEAIRGWINRPTAHQYGFGLGRATPGSTPSQDASLWVVKSNAWCSMEVGDWIVAEPDGDGHYPVALAAFADRYEPAALEGDRP